MLFGGCLMTSTVRRSRYFCVFACLATLLAALPFAHAQNFRGGINGTVTDQSGAAIPGAQLQITAEETGMKKTTVPSSAGEFDFPALPLGTYTVTATGSGFETLKVQKVPV